MASGGVHGVFVSGGVQQYPFSLAVEFLPFSESRVAGEVMMKRVSEKHLLAGSKTISLTEF
jgi:hypothetical protein